MEKQARAKLSELGLMTIQNINQAVETLSGDNAGRRGGTRRRLRFPRSSSMDEPTAALG